MLVYALNVLQNIDTKLQNPDTILRYIYQVYFRLKPAISIFE